MWACHGDSFSDSTHQVSGALGISVFLSALLEKPFLSAHMLLVMSGLPDILEPRKQLSTLLASVLSQRPKK